MDSWNKIEFIFAHKLHIPPSEVERLEFYRIQFLLNEFEEYVKRENKEYEKQQRMMDKTGAGSFKPPSMSPNMGGFKVPEFKMPAFNTPKL